MKNPILNFGILITIIFINYCFLIGCGPSKAEIEAHKKQGEIFDVSTGKFIKVANTNPYTEETEEEPLPPSSEEIHYDDIEIRVIDSCEYIIWTERGDAAGNIIHKENCRNPIHNTNQ